MNQNTFVLGLGTQKAGTSWLYQYLADQKNARMGFAKGYHILDALYMPSSARWKPNVRNHFSRLSGHWANDLSVLRGVPGLLRRRQFYNNQDAYIDYFASLVSQGEDLFTADITPSYAGLPLVAMASIRDGFAHRNMRTAAVFIMRDPVERCWSAWRMHKRNASFNKPGSRFAGSEEQQLLAYFKTEQCKVRTDYAATLSAAQAAFTSENFYPLLYEDLFTEDKLREICNFVGTDFTPIDVTHRVNPSPKTETISDDLVLQIAQYYAESYRAAADLVGSKHLIASWRSAALIL